MTTATFLVTFGAELLRQAMTGGLSVGMEQQLEQFQDEVSLEMEQSGSDLIIIQIHIIPGCRHTGQHRWHRGCSDVVRKSLNVWWYSQDCHELW